MYASPLEEEIALSNKQFSLREETPFALELVAQGVQGSLEWSGL